MRRLVVLCLIAGVGIAFADTDRWIDSPDRHVVVPNPEPGIFPEAPEVFQPAMDTFYYDDNMAAQGWIWYVAGNGWGVKFISPSDNFTLAGALVNYLSSSPGNKAMVKVFADDGPGGTPGTELWSSDTLTITPGMWNYVSIGEQIVGTNYYIFHIQSDTMTNSPYLSIDAGNNSPSHRMWTYSGGGFSEYSRTGDWLIRAVVDWTPQENNATSRYFAYRMPPDTTPSVLVRIFGMVKNLGTATLPSGTPVRLHITGPDSYTYDDTMATTQNLERGGMQQMNFMPMWQVPTRSGLYRIHVWTEAAGEDWTADDTMIYDLNIARWIEYCNFNNLRWLTWGGPQRAVKFNPAEFGLQYPVGLNRMRHGFVWDSRFPWPDSSFQVNVYAEDGSTLLYTSDTLEAPAGTPSTFMYDFDSTLIFESGEFYIAVDPVHFSGHPSSGGDDTANMRSWQGAPGMWSQWSNGEYLLSASVAGGVGVVEGKRPRVHGPVLGISNYPNPVGDFVNIRWQVPGRQQVSVGLYDATGRMIRSLYEGAGDEAGDVGLNTRALPAGIYLVRLDAEAGSVTRKLVLQH